HTRFSRDWSSDVCSSDLGERYAEKMLLVQQQILPIKLLDFNISKTINGAELKWVTASETNNNYFEPERSIDGKIFNSLGKVKGRSEERRVGKECRARWRP